MRVATTSKDILETLNILGGWLKPELKKDADLLFTYLSFDNALVITKSLPVVGNVQVKCLLSAASSGTLEITITRATIWGLTFFGLVKRAVEKLVLDYSSNLPPAVKLWKNSSGKLRVSVANIRFTSAGVSKDVLTLQGDLI